MNFLKTVKELSTPANSTEVAASANGQPEYSPMIRDLPMDLRPRERMVYAGPAALSTAELLAIILRVGGRGENVIRMAERLLAHFHGLAGLAQASLDELAHQRGVGQAKATQIKAALELGKRLQIASPQERPQVRGPEDVANLLMLEMGLLEQEHLRTVLLDTKNYVIRVANVYVGSLNSASVRVGEVFREAIRANCASIIVVHNHPSGDPTPSPEDVRVTELMIEAGKLLDIDVLDHLVIGRNRYVSLKERKLAFKP
jgi:DNA repair protein RadC